MMKIHTLLVHLTLTHLSLFSNLSLLHFNCQNSIPITHKALTLTHFSLLALQEPWFNSHTLSFPHHEAWHRITAYDYQPSEWSDRPRVCFYLSKRIPTSQFSILPSSTDILLAIDIREPLSNQVKLRVITWYNPPGSLRGFMTIKHWLHKYFNRNVPTILMTDSNLHHTIWNPPEYKITHNLAKKLVHLCSNNGLKMISPRGTPTRFSPKTRPTTIDLVWASWNITKSVKECQVLTNSIASDHLPISTSLNLAIIPMPTTHISFKVSDIDHELLHKKITSCNHLFPVDYHDLPSIDEGVSALANTILEAAQDQGKKVTTRINKFKSWWDKERLNPILKTRNRARKWMIKSGLPEAQACYLEWQKFFKDQVSRTKMEHWRKFLANCSSNDTFKAFQYVKPSSTSDIAPLKKQDNSVATTKEDQSEILFYGTSVAHADADLRDIPLDPRDTIVQGPYIFPQLE